MTVANPILFRADDAGAHPSFTAGAVATVTAGVVRNVSVMAPPPAFANAAEQLRALRHQTAIGLHVTLNCEWPGLRWRPVAAPEAVPSLVDQDGFFKFTTPAEIDAAAVPVSELVTEVRAQLGALRAAGLHPAYLDEHMGLGWVRGNSLRRALVELCREEGLLHADETLVGSPLAQRYLCEGQPDLLTDTLLNCPGRTLVVVHPACGAFSETGADAPASTALEAALVSRNAECITLTHGVLPQALARGRIRSERIT